jgi:hypothetical protein
LRILQILTRRKLAAIRGVAIGLAFVVASGSVGSLARAQSIAVINPGGEAYQHVTDGTSKTYLIGEKYIRATDYEVATGAENETWCSGFNNDNYRTAYYLPAQDRTGALPMDAGEPADGPHEERRFGSVHSGGFHVAHCDGSVVMVGYDVDPRVHRAGGNRKDGEVFQ